LTNILVRPDDGLSGRNMLFSSHWNKQLLCLTGLTVILITHNMMGLKHFNEYSLVQGTGTSRWRSYTRI